MVKIKKGCNWDNNANQSDSGKYLHPVFRKSGENGKPTIPHGFTNILRTEGYRGQVMHSSAIGDLLTNVKGKTLLMVGDSYSAEDITLQAIKHGAKFVYILGRFCNGVCQ